MLTDGREIAIHTGPVDRELEGLVIVSPSRIRSEAQSSCGSIASENVGGNVGDGFVLETLESHMYGQGPWGGRAAGFQGL